jgi:heavy metal sensor kinase
VNVRTLRFKLSLTNGLFISIFFVLFGWVRYEMFAYRAARGFERSLANQADFFAANIRPTPDGFDFKSNVVPADAMALDTIRPFFVLTDIHGQVMREELYGYYIRRMLKEKDLEDVVHHQSGFSDAEAYDGRKFRFINKVMPSEEGHVVVLHLGRALDQLTEILDEYMRIYLWSVPLVLVVAGGVGWFLAVHALSPFEEVARTAEQITSEKLNTQIENPHKEEEVQRLVQSFNSMVARLRQSFDQMRRFNADVAHELRTPLAIMQGESEIALRSESLPEDIRTVLISNLEELMRLTRIVNDILMLSEVEAGAQVLATAPIDLKPLIGDLADQMQVLALERNLEIQVRELPEAIVEADDLWMRRAVLNLLDNAIKYSREGGKIQIAMANEAGKVRINIRDEGIGISEQDQLHIFDRLFRADRARNRRNGGSGLGLALVKWVVEAHRGKITVTSAPDRGADFQVELPLAPPSSRGQTGKPSKATHLTQSPIL